MTSIETTIIKFYCPIEMGSQFIGKQSEHLLPSCELRRRKYVWIHLINDHLSFWSSQWHITNPPYKYQTLVIQVTYNEPSVQIPNPGNHTHQGLCLFFPYPPFLYSVHIYLHIHSSSWLMGCIKHFFMYNNRYEWIIWTKVNYLLNNSVTLYLVRKTYFKHIYLKFISFKVNLSVH